MSTPLRPAGTGNVPQLHHTPLRVVHDTKGSSGDASATSTPARPPLPPQRSDSVNSLMFSPPALGADGETKGNKFPDLSTHALVEQLRSRVDALLQVAHKTGLASLISAVSPVPDLLQELLTRWRASTTLALNTVSKLEEEFRGQREAHAACKLDCEHLRRQLAAVSERPAAVDDLSELRQAVKEGAQSDRVRRFFDRLDAVPASPVPSTDGNDLTRPRSLSVPTVEELTLPALTPKLPVQPQMRARSFSGGGSSVTVSHRSTRKPMALRVFTEGSSDRSSVGSAGTPRSRAVSWATKVFDLSFHEHQHAASTVADLRSAIMQLQDPDIVHASGGAANYSLSLKLRDASTGKDLLEDSATLAEAGVGLQCMLEVRYPVRVQLGGRSAASSATQPPPTLPTHVTVPSPPVGDDFMHLTPIPGFGSGDVLSRAMQVYQAHLQSQAVC